MSKIKNKHLFDGLTENSLLLMLGFPYTTNNPNISGTLEEGQNELIAKLAGNSSDDVQYIGSVLSPSSNILYQSNIIGNIDSPKFNYSPTSYLDLNKELLADKIKLIGLQNAGGIAYGLDLITLGELTRNFLLSQLKLPNYIGGNTEQSRRKYVDTHPELKEMINSTAKLYGISSDLLLNNLREGVLDYLIELNNESYQLLKNIESRPLQGLIDEYNKTIGEPETKGFTHWGFDDYQNYIDEGKIVPLYGERYKQYPKEGVFNEKNRIVHPVSGYSMLDNMGLMAAGLKYFRELAKKRYPKMSDAELDKKARAYYNKGPYYDLKKKKANGGYIPTLQDQERNLINLLKVTNTLPSVRYDNGGKLKNYNELSMFEKNEVIATAVRNGIRDPEEIRRKYNEFINS